MFKLEFGRTEGGSGKVKYSKTKHGQRKNEKTKLV